MNLAGGLTYYAGIGIDLFGIIGAEFQLETIGIGGQINFGPLSFGGNINLLGGTSITIALTTDSGNRTSNTTGFTAGINTGALVVVICAIVYYLKTNDASIFDRIRPILEH